MGFAGWLVLQYMISTGGGLFVRWDIVSRRSLHLSLSASPSTQTLTHAHMYCCIYM